MNKSQTNKKTKFKFKIKIIRKMNNMPNKKVVRNLLKKILKIRINQNFKLMKKKQKIIIHKKKINQQRNNKISMISYRK